MSMFVAVDLLIVLEHTLTGAGTHEVIVALAGCQAAAHRGTRLVAALASLFGVEGKGRASFNKMSSANQLDMSAHVLSVSKAVFP